MRSQIEYLMVDACTSYARRNAAYVSEVGRNRSMISVTRGHIRIVVVLEAVPLSRSREAGQRHASRLTHNVVR